MHFYAFEEGRSQEFEANPKIKMMIKYHYCLEVPAIKDSFLHEFYSNHEWVEIFAQQREITCQCVIVFSFHDVEILVGFALKYLPECWELKTGTF